MDPVKEEISRQQQPPSQPPVVGPGGTSNRDTPRPSQPPTSGPGIEVSETKPSMAKPPPPSRSPQPNIRTQVQHLLSAPSTLLDRDPAGLRESLTNPPSRPRTPRTKTKTSKPTTPQNGAAGGYAGGEGGLMGPAVPISSDTNRPLNVTDALSYLDAVKVQFQDKPDVYNHFLDIMKDFKSQMIDTPGVIERVSMLFHGNPYLIQGFNTFLPSGYRIDLSADPRNLNGITVTTPMGIMTQPAHMLGAPIRIPREPLHPGGHLSPFPQPPYGPPPVLPIGLGPGSRPATPMGILHPHPHAPSAFVDSAPFSPAMQGAQTTAAANFLGNLGNKAVEKSPAGEFNHAIQFLNKIKLRFTDEPDTYKQFLEILQTYQKEQRHMSDTPVLAQVSALFKNDPDLMEEFGNFLPEAMGPGPAQHGLVGIMPHPVAVAPPSANWDQGTETLPASTEKPKPPRRRKRGPEKEAPVAAKVTTGRGSKRPKHNHKPETGSPKFSYESIPSPQPQPPLQMPMQQMPHALRPQQLIPASMTHPMQPLPILTNPIAPPNVNPPDEITFFERTKKALEQNGTYEEFLKLLNLFAKDVIDTKTLIDKAEIFLDAELMALFKDLLGWDDKQGQVEFGPPGSIRTSAPDPMAPRNPDDGDGPSYRRLPDSEVRLACSGRDQLGRSVLNDEWVSHPTWASEESGFIAHKKSSFEETLHRSEEERHEYQVHIEALVRTIAVLDPIDTRIEEMSPEERTALKLPYGLGGDSPSLYEKMIRKVYGRDAAHEVLKALQESPGFAVPVVLARLKQKCEEWKRNQREWNRTWREVDAKNFYKALDHQGITFKANDKKNITAKSFVQEIEGIKASQLKSIEDSSNVPTTLPRYQLEYEFRDTTVLHDSLKMIYSFLDHSQAQQYSGPERRSIEKFLRSFIPLLFMFSPHEFNAACGLSDTQHEEDHMEDQAEAADETTKSTRERTGRRSATGIHSSGVAANDLRKRLLKTVQEGSSPGRRSNHHKGSPSQSVDSASPANSDSPLVPPNKTSGETRSGLNLRSKPEDIWTREIGHQPQQEGYTSAGDERAARRPFFANTTFYTLIRLLQTLYSRLLVCKEIGAQLAKEKHASLLANPVAVALGLDDPNGPSVVLAQAIEAVGDARAEENPNVLYMYLLEACDKMFENELDQATFEEHMRWFFGTRAFNVFTLDRVIAAIIKQVQTIQSDGKCQEVLYLLQKARNEETVSLHDIIRYRREAELNVGSDDHLYKVDWDEHSRMLRLQLVGSDEPSVAEGDDCAGRWKEYVATYVTRYPTEWMPQGLEKNNGRLFLKRCLIDPEDLEKSSVRESSMGLQIDVHTYKLLYESGKEDIFWRGQGKDEERLRRQGETLREERSRTRWLK